MHLYNLTLQRASAINVRSVNLYAAKASAILKIANSLSGDRLIWTSSHQPSLFSSLN